MQRIAALLSIFILLLSMAQCADAWEGSDCESEEICETSNEENGSNNEDDCLPFCSCMCCTAVMTVASQTFEFQEIVTTTDDLKLEEIAYSPPAFDIWQPPKI